MSLPATSDNTASTTSMPEGYSMNKHS